MLAGFRIGFFGSFLFDLVVWPTINGLIVPTLIFCAVLLIFWGSIKPLLSAVLSKAKGLIPKFRTSVSAPTMPAKSTTSGRVALWEQLYEACDPAHGACPKAREILQDVFQHLAPFHAEATK